MTGSGISSKDEGMLMYVGGGAALGYFGGPSIFPDGTTAMTAALYGAGLGYLAYRYWGQKPSSSS